MKQQLKLKLSMAPSSYFPIREVRAREHSFYLWHRMRLPRRVPWASVGELEQLCSWIYTDDDNGDSKLLAINRLSAWKNITTLPHALESTLSLLVVIAQDVPQSALPSHLSLRQSYATAIIRLVNGLVDPLQVGAYARSIASIATQLGFPSWLVELRHAATHEDLPSIGLLREAARQSMSWLLHNYFLPTINPFSAPQQVARPLRSLTPVLKQYKGLMKIVTRDASVTGQYRLDIVTVMKDIERWIAEAEVVAGLAVQEEGWEPSQSNDSSSAKERWAIKRLCDSLLEKGALVPLAKKKRTLEESTFTPQKNAISLWCPLLKHIQSVRSNFAVVLCDVICSRLLNIDDAKLETNPDPSYEVFLASWVMWAIETWSGELWSKVDLKRDVTVALVRGLGHHLSSSKHPRTAASTLLRRICRDQEMDRTLALLLSPPRNFAADWEPQDLLVMSERLQSLQSIFLPEPPKRMLSVQRQSLDLQLAGWRVLDEEREWKQCPIGVFA